MILEKVEILVLRGGAERQWVSMGLPMKEMLSTEEEQLAVASDPKASCSVSSQPCPLASSSQSPSICLGRSEQPLAPGPASEL